eukprot:CAMPEP_0195306626 /NCGR_PEP_ID=MMETSP0707-20130614/37296_1 /TAXON_ID=33640 /ORGANISM="Asterionellopsis glacialis, Strain CCMP134" /LENGTH=82 /DNA_ID=CAMNT_0040370847 /DNA_START=1 /DNA_END=246 /DNA_ORIENTATION=+
MQRSLRGGDFSPDALKRQKTSYGVTMASSSRSLVRKLGHPECYQVLTGLLSAMKQGTWCRILSLCNFDDATNDIKKAMGIPW